LVEISKNYLNIDLKTILLDQNNYVKKNDEQCCKKFLYSNNQFEKYVLHNYFDSSIKLFLDLYLIKFLDFSAKPFKVYKI